jgi:hypothetical protein
VNFRVEKRWRGEAIALELQSHKPRKHTSQPVERSSDTQFTKSEKKRGEPLGKDRRPHCLKKQKREIFNKKKNRKTITISSFFICFEPQR